MQTSMWKSMDGYKGWLEWKKVCEKVCGKVCGKVGRKVCGKLCWEVCRKVCEKVCGKVYPHRLSLYIGGNRFEKKARKWLMLEEKEKMKNSK